MARSVYTGREMANWQAQSEIFQDGEENLVAPVTFTVRVFK
jgi:hypothetical protein